LGFIMSDSHTRYYRWALGLFGGYLIFAVVVALVLLATINDVNAGYPALFFGGLYAAAGLPVFIASAVFSAKSLARREPHRLAVIGVLVICCLWALIMLRRIFQIIWTQLT
jgi:drug/metabolite transporter superfamily protein YnfA